MNVWCGGFITGCVLELFQRMYAGPITNSDLIDLGFCLTYKTVSGGDSKVL